MNQQAFDIASSFLPQMQDDATALRDVGDIAYGGIENFGFASQLHRLTQTGDVQPDVQTGEVRSKDLSMSLFLEPEGAQPIKDLSDAYKNADVSMPQQTISTSTWQAWLEQQVPEVGVETYPKQQSAAVETDTEQALGATEEGLSEIPSPPAFLATAQWAQTQRALVREEPVAQDSSSTRASASSDTAAGISDPEQQQLFGNTSTDKQADVVRQSVSSFAPADGRQTSDARVATSFAQRATTTLANSDAQTASAVLPNVDADDARDDAQMPLWAFGDAPAIEKGTDASGQGLQTDWDVGAQTRLAQALPAQTSAPATLEATFADKLSDFAMLAPHGNQSSGPVASSGWATEPTPASSQENLDVPSDAAGEMAPAKAPSKHSDALFGTVDDEIFEATDVDAKTTLDGVHERATADVRTDSTDEHTRLKEAEDPIIVDSHEDADAQRGAIAVQLTAAPSTTDSQSAFASVDTANTPQKVSQGLEAYNSQARQARLDTDERSGSADSAKTTQAPGDATGKAGLKGRSAAGFATNLAEVSDAEPQHASAASPHEAASAAASRTQSSDGLVASESKVTSPSVAEGAQAAAMTATVTPSRLSAQLAANLSDGARRIQLRVAPPGLGTLDIGVHLQGAQVHLTVRGDQPDLTRFLQEGMSDLQKNLQQHGLDLGNTDFRGGEGSAQADGESPRGNLSQDSKAASPQARSSDSTPQTRDAHVINVLL